MATAHASPCRLYTLVSTFDPCTCSAQYNVSGVCVCVCVCVSPPPVLSYQVYSPHNSLVTSNYQQYLCLCELCLRGLCLCLCELCLRGLYLCLCELCLCGLCLCGLCLCGLCLCGRCWCELRDLDYGDRCTHYEGTLRGKYCVLRMRFPEEMIGLQYIGGSEEINIHTCGHTHYTYCMTVHLAEGCGHYRNGCGQYSGCGLPQPRGSGDLCLEKLLTQRGNSPLHIHTIMRVRSGSTLP